MIGPCVLSRCSAKSSSSLCGTRRPGTGRRGRTPDQPAYVLLGERLLPPDQRQRRREPLQVPREPAEVGLVEVVDVEDQAAVGVQVGAEVLHVQVAVHPDPAAVLVGERVLVARDVGVEEARAAPVERVRVGRHLPVLRAERDRVRLHQRGERVVQDGHDQVGALLVGAGGGHARHPAMPSTDAVPRRLRGCPFVLDCGETSWSTAGRNERGPTTALDRIRRPPAPASASAGPSPDRPDEAATRRAPRQQRRPVATYSNGDGRARRSPHPAEPARAPSTPVPPPAAPSAETDAAVTSDVDATVAPPSPTPADVATGRGAQAAAEGTGHQGHEEARQEVGARSQAAAPQADDGHQGRRQGIVRE